MNTPTTETIKRRINKEIYALGVYHPEVPLGDIFSIVERHAGKVVQEDGTAWSGWLCGEDGDASFQIASRKHFWLRIQWHKMQSGNYEITAFVS